MKHSTKTVASLLVVTAVAAAIPGVSQVRIGSKRLESQFDRLLQRHDRKGELRAEVLGIPAAQFKIELRKKSLQQIAAESGFASKRAFRLALLGRLRNELRGRGWTTRQIDQYVLVRAERLS